MPRHGIAESIKASRREKHKSEVYWRTTCPPRSVKQVAGSKTLRKPQSLKPTHELQKGRQLRP